MKQTFRCRHCGTDNPAETLFSEWCRDCLLRSDQGLVICDCDYVAHRYMTNGSRAVQFTLHVEVKTRMAELTRSQRDTLAIDHQGIRTHNASGRDKKGRLLHSGNTNARKVWSPENKCYVWLNFLGWHTLRMSGETPSDSEIILWDNRYVSLEQTAQLLQMDIHPRSFNPLSPRARKKKKRLPLFEREP